MSLFEECLKCITTNLEISNCEDEVGNKPDDNLFTISKMCSDTFHHQLRM
jgi:hypothetical protein